MAVFNRTLTGATGSDNFQTPGYAVSPLLPYLRPGSLIWEPCHGEGNLTAALTENRFRLIYTDVGFDFLKPFSETDETVFGALPYTVVTNPPYSLKDKFLERCYALEKPFALLLPLTAIEGARRQELYRKHGIEIIAMDRRINFKPPTPGKPSSAWFATAWFTHGLNIGAALSFARLPSDNPFGKRRVLRRLSAAVSENVE